MLKHGILGLLNYHDMTGYTIMEVFRDSLNFFWSAQTSQIYRELQSLEKQSFVKKTVFPQEKKPDKNVYSITEAGKGELLRWLAEDGPALRPRIPILMKVFFMGERSQKQNLLFFRALKKECEDFKAHLASVPEKVVLYGNLIDDNKKALYWQMTLDYGRMNVQMYIDWAARCIDKLENLEDVEGV